MREFKFRAWDAYGEGMIRVYDISLDNNQVGGIGNDDMFCLLDGDYTLMQSTGIKDINGAEIYEGDIVKHWNPMLKDSNVCGLVQWEPADSMFRIITGGACYDLHFALKLEVVGNKFETPGLIRDAG